MEISLPVINNPVVVALDSFDIEEYCRRYTGATKHFRSSSDSDVSLPC